MDSEKLTAYAHDLGLALLGVVRIGPVAHPHLSEWIASGKNADMQCMERSRDKRLHPDQVLPNAKSMMLVTLNYFQGDPPQEIIDDPGRGLIARYAWYPEYHTVLQQKLDALIRYIQKETGNFFLFGHMLIPVLFLSGIGQNRPDWVLSAKIQI